MTRRPSSASERVRPDRNRSLSTFLFAVAAVLVVACGGVETSSPSTGGSALTTRATASAGAPASAGATSSPDASTAPSHGPTATASRSPAPTRSPASDSSAEPTASPSPGPSASAGPAAACTGSAKNQDFYAEVTAAVDWTVYCPVLPAGWFVDAGQYRAAGGGRMEIGYRGPGGARLSLREGSFCTDPGGCVPDGTDAGPAAFGDRDGSLIAASDGSWAVVVDAGKRPSWIIEGSGLDQAAFTKVAADLVALGS